MNETGAKPLTVGWREFVALPDWGIPRIKAKVDTGARSSAIDVADIREVSEGQVQFDVRLSRRDPTRSVTVTAPIVRRTTIRSSLGRPHDRIIVATTVRIGPIEKLLELGLVCRKDMLCRMLLGRRALQGTFIVDPGRPYLLGPAPRKRAAPKPESRSQP